MSDFIDRREFIHGFFELSRAFAAVAPYARQCNWHAWPDVQRYYADLNALGAPVAFVRDSPALAYELHIGATAQVPTRHALWHDYFNALVWCRFPRAKLQINALHRAHWTRTDAQIPPAPTPRRTPVRDGLTLLDESGALVICDDEDLLTLLRNMNWPELFVAQRSRVEQHMRIIVFGHGLLEKFLQPYIGMPLDALCAWADDYVAQRLHAAGHLMPADLSPLPILGVPRWWEANREPSFYDDERYFRRHRQRVVR